MNITYALICLQGGFGSTVLQRLTDTGALDAGSLRARSMVVPDIWIEAGPQKEQYDIANLNQPHIVDKVAKLLSASGQPFISSASVLSTSSALKL